MENLGTLKSVYTGFSSYFTKDAFNIELSYSTGSYTVRYGHPDEGIYMAGTTRKRKVEIILKKNSVKRNVWSPDDHYSQHYLVQFINDLAQFTPQDMYVESARKALAAHVASYYNVRLAAV